MALHNGLYSHQSTPPAKTGLCGLYEFMFSFHARVALFISRGIDLFAFDALFPSSGLFVSTTNFSDHFHTCRVFSVLSAFLRCR